MEYQIKLIQQSPVVTDLFPDYQYQFVDQDSSEESQRMYESLLEFIQTNAELAMSNISMKEEYTKGFKQSLALTRLWLDSMYLRTGVDRNEQTNFTPSN